MIASTAGSRGGRWKLAFFTSFEASLEDLGEEGGLARAGNWSDEVVGGKEGGGSVAIAGEDPPADVGKVVVGEVRRGVDITDIGNPGVDGEGGFTDTVAEPGIVVPGFADFTATVV